MFARRLTLSEAAVLSGAIAGLFAAPGVLVSSAPVATDCLGDLSRYEAIVRKIAGDPVAPHDRPERAPYILRLPTAAYMATGGPSAPFPTASSV
jgi:hypothetical protein